MKQVVDQDLEELKQAQARYKTTADILAKHEQFEMKKWITAVCKKSVETAKLEKKLAQLLVFNAKVGP